ncbi:hypothetical protein [Peribacillus sp. FSL E2-0159]|uniref:hypothetical protein n=1 Tax=Peribacillus sp. FSL E2-0159 TaxID=2975289 RepID=UPI00315A3BE3
MLPILDKGSKVRYSRSLKKHINKLRPLKGGEWDFDDEEISNIKKLIRVQLMKHQDAKCAYCGLAFDGTSRAEIEHIAPKGGKKRPKYTTFTFTPYNLVLSCHLCNSPVKKGSKDTVSIFDVDYKKCEFKIYHPYFDNPSDHFEWIADGYGVLIQHKTLKGSNSIKMFGLDDTAHIEARAKEVVYKLLKSRDRKESEDLIQAALNFKG